jgi:hypothetical protein
MLNLTAMTKEKIIQELQKGFEEVIVTVQPVADSTFFRKPDSKWSASNNIEHLILSVKPLTLAFQLPKFILLYFGKPNRPIRTYEELEKKYLEKLSAGGRATSAFVPKSNYQDKRSLLENFKQVNEGFIKSLAKWNDADLDRYLIPHPLLGKLYLREMLYFTIYHTQHHLRAIENCVIIRPAN